MLTDLYAAEEEFDEHVKVLAASHLSHHLVHKVTELTLTQTVVMELALRLQLLLGCKTSELHQNVMKCLKRKFENVKLC